MAELRQAAVVVVGAGPAGIAAACRSAEAGAEVLLVDEGPTPGGQIWRRGRQIELPTTARHWLESLAHLKVESLALTTVVDALPDRTLVAEAEGRAVRIHGDRLIIATGARELFLPFPGWTLPGVVGVGAVQALLKSGARFDSQATVVAGSGPLLLPVAAALRADGARLCLVADQAPAAHLRRFTADLWRLPSKLVEAVRYRLGFFDTPYKAGVWVLEARGDERVEEVVLTDGPRTWTQACELLCCSYGLIPNVELARWLGCETTNSGVVVDGEQRTTIENVLCAGEADGVGGAELAIVEGEIAAAVATGRTQGLGELQRRCLRLRKVADSMRHAFMPRPELEDRLQLETIVCRCEDVAWQQLDPTWSSRQAKLYTRFGMGPCQGRVCGPAAQVLLGWGSDSVRPPLKPCRVATLVSPEFADPENGEAGF